MAGTFSDTRDQQISQLQQQLTEVENRFAQSQQEKTQMEAEFEYKRAKIKELYFAKENTIREQGSKLFEASKQISELEATLSLLRDELENLKMVASVSENTKQEAVEDLNKHHQEEIESLRCVLQDSMEEQRGELLVQFEQERRRWEEEKTKIEDEQKRLREMWAQAQTSLQQKTNEFSVLVDRELETSMLKAQHEAENLKSVVVPLENEIADLKEKLKRAEEEILTLTPDEQPGDVTGRLSEQEAASHVEVEGNRPPQRADKLAEAELFTDALETEVGVLRDENDMLKVEMHEVCRMLEHEQAMHAELKRTWNAANEQFILSQNDLNAKLKQARSLLSEKQLRKLDLLSNGLGQAGQGTSDQKTKDQGNSDPPTLTAVNGTSFFRSVSHDSFGPFQDHPYENHDDLPPSYDASAKLASSPSAESGDERLARQVSTTDREAKSVRVNSAPDLNELAESEEPSSPFSKRRATTTKEAASPLQGTKHRSDLSDESSPARHLKLVRAKETEIEKLTAQCNKLTADLEEAEKRCKAERAHRADVEESVMRASEDAQKQIRSLMSKLDSLEQKMKDDQSYRRKKEAEDNERLMEMTSDRDKVLENFRHLKNDQNALKNSFEKTKHSLEKESKLPTTTAGLKICLDRYREGYATVQVEKMHLESTLQTQISFLRSSTEALQREKEQIENALSTELDEARQKIVHLQSVQDQLRKEISEKQDLRVQIERDQLSMDSIRAKSREIIKNLKDKLLHETNEKEALENQLARAKNQVRSLQESLETSEHVQRDFVKLSQSLQVQLEDIRQKEEAKEKRSATRAVEDASSGPSRSHSARASSDQSRPQKAGGT